MNYLIALIAAGLATGAIYGLVAIGFAIIYKATGIINFAQGEMVMLNAYLGLSIATFSGVGF
ncbi:MAG: branched-chain amino acid ABC transporter permease, partial [Donghicola eburneus]|nr:branched-chain amino acid ABC transporter permease [Donghicola eburneus]